MSGAGEFSPPWEFEEYRLLRSLGRGAMGQVYLAQDRLLERLVAVKFIAPGGGGLPEEAARARFFQEARAIARLQHPNVVAIHRVGEVRRQPYLVSEFIRGVSLDALPKPVEARQVLHIAIGLSRGLAAAHRCGVLHRDIKPANALLSEEGEVKLVDFGLAELAERLLPETGAARGAPSPAPPLALPLAPPLVPRATGPGRETRPLPRFAPEVPEEPRATRPLPDTAPPAPVHPGPRATPAPAVGAPLPAAGTPLYLAPELWRGEPASRASDIYALGVLLYELCTGQAPHEGMALSLLARAVQEQRPRPLAEVAPGLPSGLAQVVERCLEVEPPRRFDSGDALREALESLATPPRARALPSGNPYRGLQSFDAGHRGVFFGREAELREVVDRLRATAFVLVAGESGVGKSSLCRAGVLPVVEETGLGDEGAWRVARLVPGRRPLESLAEALAAVLGEDARELEHRLVHPDAEPGLVANALRRRPPGAPRVLLFVDQLEELVTLSPAGEAARLAEELAFVVRRVPGARVLGTARSDCLTRLMTLPGLGDELPRALHLLRALSSRGLREAIVGPARALGVRFESEALVDTLVEATPRTEGGLPLLQFALAELWEARERERGLISAAALESMGGVAGALARHADNVVARLRPEQRPQARELLLALVTPEGTRARRTATELRVGPENTVGRAVLEGLVQGRLLLAGETDGGEGSYELAHESLLTGWDTLRGWLGQGEQRRAVRQRLERTAAEWERLGHPTELLYADKRLAEVAEARPEALGPRELEFLARSRRAARGRRARRWALVLVVPLGVLVAVGAVRWQVRARLDASVAARLGESRRLWEQARRRAAEAGALRGQAFSRFDTPRARAGAEVLWSRAREAMRDADVDYAQAASALEAAWTLAPSRDDVRALFTDLLAERVALAERDGRPQQRDELMARLVVHDVSGARRRQWEAPARLTVRTRPEQARVELLGAGASPGRELGASPVVAAELGAGSHVLVLEAPERDPVRVPVLLRPGERLSLEVDLPPSQAVPAGFVYVPAGRFLQGSGDEALRRTFFNAAPLHEVHTEDFLISREEVTWGDWMAYLDALPTAERAARTPGTREALGGVTLEKKGERWRLTLRPTSERYVAWEGEPLRYGRRERRAVQDWRRFPVSALSFEDAEAYAAWLASTGRVPGARLCTETEWERAARGADGRRFPSGDTLAPDDANIDVTYGRDPLGFGPDEVGSHPRSRSPFGVDDLAGNVWEWVRSAEDPRQPVIRGGSWFQSEIGSQSANRESMERTLREPLIGLRLCATPSWKR